MRVGFPVVCRIVCGFVLTTALGGCVTAPAGGDAVASAYKVGDRSRVGLHEVVVSLRLRESATAYQNLHVGLTVFINPTQATLISPYDAEGIVQRCQGRLNARLVELLTDAGEQRLAESGALREKCRAAGQAVIDEAMARWEHAGEYRAEVAITSWYWTDASKGR